MGFLNKLKSVNNSWGYVTYLSDGSLGRIFGRIGPKNMIDNRSQELMITSGTMNGPLKKEIVFAAKDVLRATVLQATSEWVKYRLELNNGLVAIVVMTVMGLPTGRAQGNKTTLNANFNNAWLNFEAWLGEALEREISETSYERFENSYSADLSPKTELSVEAKKDDVISVKEQINGMDERPIKKKTSKCNESKEKQSASINQDTHFHKLNRNEEKDSHTNITAPQTILTCNIDKPIFRDYDRDEEIKKTRKKELMGRVEVEKEKHYSDPMPDVITKTVLRPEEKMSYWKYNMQHIYFLERRFRVDISIEESFDMVKEKLCNIKALNDTESLFLKKIKLCNTFEEMFTIWSWFINFYS